MEMRGRTGTIRIIVAVAVLMLCSLAPMANSETVTRGCDAAQCFYTQFTLYDIDRNRSDFLYEINDDWYDNYTALELMTYVLSTQNMTYTTAHSESTEFIEVNGTTSNSSWGWAVYIDEDGMWVSTNLTVEQIVIKNIDNYAVCLIPFVTVLYAEGGEHDPFSQSVGDWLTENAVDDYFHSSGNVNSNGELVGITKSGNDWNKFRPWMVRTNGELLGTDLTEIEMRVEGGAEAGSTDEMVASMTLSNGTENVTVWAGWWELTWNDADGDGKFSVGDTWVLRTDSTHGYDYYATFVRIESDDGNQNGNTSGFGLLLTLSAVSIIAMARRPSRD
jgi:hypothetical protein